jgi:hypothetical protein
MQKSNTNPEKSWKNIFEIARKEYQKKSNFVLIQSGA